MEAQNERASNTAKDEWSGSEKVSDKDINLDAFSGRLYRRTAIIRHLKHLISSISNLGDYCTVT